MLLILNGKVVALHMFSLSWFMVVSMSICGEELRVAHRPVVPHALGTVCFWAISETWRKVKSNGKLRLFTFKVVGVCRQISIFHVNCQPKQMQGGLWCSTLFVISSIDWKKQPATAHQPVTEHGPHWLPYDCWPVSRSVWLKPAFLSESATSLLPARFRCTAPGWFCPVCSVLS